MAKTQRSNYLPYIQQHLDTQNDIDGVPLDVVCGICQENKLDISKSARDFTSFTNPPAEHIGTHRHLPNYIKHGLERTVALACGHVFGDRCVRDLLGQQSDLTCPSCGFRAAYTGCDHAIRPALVPVDGYDSVRDSFPLTIAEGGADPTNCLECRWKFIRSNIRYALSDECILCRHKNDARILFNPTEHRTHRDQHVHMGLRRTLDDVVLLVWPEFVTRETESSAAKALADSDRRQIQVSLLNAMVLSELEDTIWYRTKGGKPNSLTKEQLKKHTRGLASIEQSLLSWLMDSTREPRRMW
ncbi:hypothetical protein F4819DRAFT_474266 [Hypoxylon fuscum]|nr:hypothetical protein F4819DRAFT_474266 [Hypoxylon fuscum]